MAPRAFTSALADARVGDAADLELEATDAPGFARDEFVEWVTDDLPVLHAGVPFALELVAEHAVS
ncbi:hypothetical protein J2X63_002838 [Agromyces sp. 3263]|uniref:hypothetical protein n=1 Tax=Agromyces sp. 3263 TaxID=2817750 RepID=UPI00285B5894|nr:hypothetical protein [Agromyces sp. 3263]MDR6907130.1 hypothetical protein [Agromyces sp. 3263]